MFHLIGSHNLYPLDDPQHRSGSPVVHSQPCWQADAVGAAGSVAMSDWRESLTDAEQREIERDQRIRALITECREQLVKPATGGTHAH